MKKIVLFGCGAGADTATRYIRSDKDDTICAYTVDARYLPGPQFKGLPVVPFEEVERRYPPEDHLLFIPLGYESMNHLRAEKYSQAKKKGYTLYSYISSKSFLHQSVECGENCFILEGQCINFDVKIGNNVVLWSGNHIGDRTVIGDHVWLSSHVTVAGDVSIKDHCFLGSNSTVSNRVVLEPETFVGATCFITSHTKKGSVYLREGSKPSHDNSLEFLKVLQAAQKM